MSSQSSHLSLPYIQQNRVQKHVAHNKALRVLDAVVQLTVLSRVLTDQLALPICGDRYIVPVGATHPQI